MASTPEGLLVLEDASVNVNIVNHACSVQISQRYFNKSDNPLEVTYEIQLIDHATIVEFNAKLEDGTILVGKVQEITKAQNNYDDTIASGGSALLVEKQSNPSNWFSCSLGNVPSKSRITILLRYVSLLEIKDNSLIFHMNKIMNNYQQFYRKLSSSLHVDIQLGNIMEDIICMSNENATIQFSEDKKNAQISVPSQDFTEIQDLWVDKPISFTIFTKEAQITKWIIEEHASKESDITCYLHFAPFLKEIIPETPQEFVFVLDRSGSMSGSKMTSAKNALQIFLRSLPSGYFFNIIGFGSNYSKLYDHCVAYDQDSFQKSTSHVQQIEANLGGTDIHKPLQNVFSDKQYKTNSKRVVFLITDGCVSNAQEVVNLVNENSKTHKVFCVGIGWDADHKLLSDIAKVSGTKPIMVKDDDRIEPKIMECVRMALTPVVKNVTVSWELGGYHTVKTSPQYQLPEFYDGDCSYFYAWMKKTSSQDSGISGKVVIKATTEVAGTKFGEMVPKEHSWEIAVQDAMVVKNSDNSINNNANSLKFPLISSLAAKSRIDELLSYKRNTSDAEQLNKYKQEIIELGIAHNIASEYCSFLVVSEGNEAIERTLKRVDIKPSSAMPDLAGVRRGLKKEKKEKKDQLKADKIAQANAPDPNTAGGVAKGTIVMINGRPCKLVDKTTSKTGKHGHAKVHLVGIDPVTGKKFEAVIPASQALETPPPPPQDDLDEDMEEYEDEEELEIEKKKAPPVAVEKVRIGGKGTPRRKHKAAKKVSESNEDKKLQASLQQHGGQSVEGVEQVDLYNEDGSVIHFDSPEVKADMNSNMIVVSGSPQLQQQAPAEQTPTYTPPPAVKKMDVASLDALLQPLVQLQQLEGKWELTQQLASLISVPLSDLISLMESLLGVDITFQPVLATALAISILEKAFPQRKDEWSLLVKKAWSWLKEQEAVHKGSWRGIVLVSKVTLFLKNKTRVPIQ